MTTNTPKLKSISFVNNNRTATESAQVISNENYYEWLTKNKHIESTTNLPDHKENPPPSLSFILIVRLPQGLEVYLADTLDNLAKFHLPWHLVVVSDSPPPSGINEIDCIQWLSTRDANPSKLHALITQIDTDWVIETPPGTYISESLFSSLAKVDLDRTCAVFADNDYYDADGKRHAPRFKPGVNPTALMSADLAGPLCLPRHIWLTLPHSSDIPLPWLGSLWAVALKYGWPSIVHLPHILFSLPDSARRIPCDSLTVLEKELTQFVQPTYLQAINNVCWSVLWSLPDIRPSINILIQTNGDTGLIERCIYAINEKTNYPAFSLSLLVASQIDTDPDPDLDQWLNLYQVNNPNLAVWRQGEEEAYNHFVNRVATQSTSEFILFLSDELMALHADWLTELVRACQPGDIAGASPRLIQAQSGHIENCGYVLGLQGWRGSAYFRRARVQTLDDFDWIDASRDITTLTSACALIRTQVFRDAGGLDDLNAPAPGLNTGFALSLADLSLRLHTQGQRLIYAPRANLGGQAEPSQPRRNSVATLARQSLAEDVKFNTFKSRWWPQYAHDPYWNPNLSLVECKPQLETEYRADWFSPYKSSAALSPPPKILAHIIRNAQADFRITDALRLLRQNGRVSSCVWESGLRYHSAAELSRLAPDTHIIQHYIHQPPLDALNSWHSLPKRPFTVYVLDDVITGIDPSSPFFKNFEPDSRSRLAYALARCDRMVVSTDFLAEHYRSFIRDIRVVPNRLEMSKWLSLRSKPNTGDKPRIGWAGGVTHERDLLLLKEVIERTRHEADWVFFGMCPKEIAPLLAEFHPFVPYADYPAFLASLGLDIAVAPLAQTLFNRGKSNLRLLEFGVLGIPVVCTDIEPYQNSPACRVLNRADDWVKALRERIHDQTTRVKEGGALRQWVARNFLLENHLDEWLSAHLPE